QNAHFEASGAFTGEVAPAMLQALGCRRVILGHSERRTLFQETDELVQKKVRAALEAELQPILCLGETLEERDGEQTLTVVSRQLQAGLEGVTAADMARVVVAYEPVWAIGTGRTATPDQAQEVHAHLRSQLRSMFDDATADGVRIQYGGSMKPKNAAELLAMPDIDGGLIGGASLKADDFAAICAAAAAVSGA
ncbi:MAG: triose-phosphate isomerase, partial [Myxococcota bacterium]